MINRHAWFHCTLSSAKLALPAIPAPKVGQDRADEMLPEPTETESKAAPVAGDSLAGLSGARYLAVSGFLVALALLFFF